DEPLPVPLFGKDNVGNGPHEGARTAPPAESHENQEPLSNVGAANQTAASEVVFENGWKDRQAAEAGSSPASAAATGDRSPNQLNECQPEGLSITKDCRGDWIRTSDLLNPIQAR